MTRTPRRLQIGTNHDSERCCSRASSRISSIQTCNLGGSCVSEKRVMLIVVLLCVTMYVLSESCAPIFLILLRCLTWIQAAFLPRPSTSMSNLTDVEVIPYSKQDWISSSHYVSNANVSGCAVFAIRIRRQERATLPRYHCAWLYTPATEHNSFTDLVRN